MSGTFGWDVPTSKLAPRHVVGAVERTPAGNVALRIGREHPQGWEQVAYVVLSPRESRALAAALIHPRGERDA